MSCLPQRGLLSKKRVRSTLCKSLPQSRDYILIGVSIDSAGHTVSRVLTAIGETYWLASKICAETPANKAVSGRLAYLVPQAGSPLSWKVVAASLSVRAGQSSCACTAANEDDGSCNSAAGDGEENGRSFQTEHICMRKYMCMWKSS